MKWRINARKGMAIILIHAIINGSVIFNIWYLLENYV